MKKKNNKIKELIHELKHHLPFTAIATILAIILVILIIYLSNSNVSEELFNILHPLHILASAIVTAGIFYRYKQNFFQALLVGMLGSIIIGSISDVIFPYLGAVIFQLKPEFHLPIIEKPILILSSVILGSLIGITTKVTKLPHLLHVFISVFASLFYLLTFSSVFSWIFFLLAFIIVLISVIIPCCVSDIIFPFFFLGKKIKHCNCH